MSSGIARSVMAAGLLMGVARTAAADAVEDFYRRTDVHFTVGVAVGGSYDTTGRLVARHIGKHIPGHPKVQIANMPGASSRVATNWAYSVAPKDGTVIVAVSEAIPMAQAMG